MTAVLDASPDPSRVAQSEGDGSVVKHLDRRFADVLNGSTS
jgi:hypothetical protein